METKMRNGSGVWQGRQQSSSRCKTIRLITVGCQTPTAELQTVSSHILSARLHRHLMGLTHFTHISQINQRKAASFFHLVLYFPFVNQADMLAYKQTRGMNDNTRFVGNLCDPSFLALPSLVIKPPQTMSRLACYTLYLLYFPQYKVQGALNYKT